MTLPPGVRVEPGHGGLAKVVVETPLARAEVYLHGAHVTHYQPAGRGPALFLSRQSRFDPTKAIRGGVPICFPWFGPLAGRPAAPAHGFARTSAWTLTGATADPGGAVTVTLTLAGDGTGSADWPHPFRASYAVTVGAELQLALTVERPGGGPVPGDGSTGSQSTGQGSVDPSAANRSSAAPFTYTAALHSYLSVGDVRRVAVNGLEATSYADKVLAGRDQPPAAAPLTFAGETDRVYRGTTAAVTVDDPALGRRLTVAKSGSASTVVWNPWAAKAAALPDLADDEWPRFLCIETANVGPAAVTLAPGESHTMTAVLRAADR